jgi:8-hydroxy-5-deazaflavin:NADPH oxidoreductase
MRERWPVRIGIFGSGEVGGVLADGFLKHGYEVMRSSRDPEKMAKWREAAGPNAKTGTWTRAAEFGDVLVLAVKGGAAEAVIAACGPRALAGKTVIDVTNPIADLPPEGGVLQLFTERNESLMERLQKIAPEARFVKAFSCVGSGLMVNPRLETGIPTMFICGNDANAKQVVTTILTQFGWESADMGGVQVARAIEPLCVLWCVPGFLTGSWNHAFKLLR